MKPELLDGTPPGTIAVTHPSGWIQLDLFTRWFEHFVQTVKPTKEDPVILILDGHHSHTRNVDIIQRGREHGVSIVCLPPHCTDRMQPLDVAFMYPFKTYYAQEVGNWLDSHENRVVSHYQIGELMGRAYVRAATMTTATNGFRATWIYPLNQNIFTDADFLKERSEVEPNQGNNDLVLPGDIRPIPVIEPSTSTRRGSAVLVTGSPHKNAVEAAIEKKRQKEATDVARKQQKTPNESVR